MRQTTKADLIVVHVSLESRTENITKQQLHSYLDVNFGPCMPSALIRNGIQCKNSLLAVTGLDHGPATKLLGTLLLPMLDGEACIVTVDDDMIYDPQLIKELTSRAPDNGALGFSCEEVPWNLHLVRDWINSDSLWWTVKSGGTGWMYPFQEVIECKGWLHGYQGILYRRKSLSQDIWNIRKMPNGCFYADDVRLAGYLWTKRIKRWVYPHFVRGGVETFTGMEKNASNALSLVPNTMADNQWPCVQYFNEFRS